MRALPPMLMLTLAAFTLHAELTVKQVLDRLAVEASAFQRNAPDLLGRETLHQRALKPPPRFRLRAGESAKQAPAPEWQEREIVSEYGFSSLPDDSLHELRQVISVDGRKVRDVQSAQDALAKLITASDGERKIQSLKQLEKYGLRGAVTDFGQLLLLFERRQQERYEFTESPGSEVSGTPAFVLRYKQLDGPEALTVVQGTGGAQNLRIAGEIFVRRTDAQLLRVTMTASGVDGGEEYRQEAAVDYGPSDFGTLLPLRVEHRERHGAATTVENKFTYADFHRFSAQVSPKN